MPILSSQRNFPNQRFLRVSSVHMDHDNRVSSFLSFFVVVVAPKFCSTFSSYFICKAFCFFSNNPGNTIMPPLSKAASNATEASASNSSGNPWIPVTWFPHTSLSQTCYVKLTVRAAFDRSSANDDNEVFLTGSAAAAVGEWRVRATVHGMAGTPLGLPSETSAASLGSLSEWKQGRPPADLLHRRSAAEHCTPLLVDGGCTRGCVWEETIRLPVRWRDLPRDAYLQLDILGPADEMVRFLA